MTHARTADRRVIVAHTSSRHITLVAALILVFILALHLVMWPVPYLGFSVDARTGIVTHVEVNGSADRAGIRVDDQISTMYDQPWSVVAAYPNVFDLAPLGQPIAISVQRGTIHRATVLIQSSPTVGFQIIKLLNLLLALRGSTNVRSAISKVLTCWLTGYVFGVIRRHASAYHLTVACFWLGLSCVIGAYYVAIYAAPYLWLTLQWFTLTILMPLAIHIHGRFPIRTRHTWLISQRMLFSAWLVLNTMLLAAVLWWRPTPFDLMLALDPLLAPCVVISCCASGILLFAAYRQTTVQHLRRQIRLIGSACSIVAVLWLVTLVIPSFAAPFVTTLIGKRMLDLALLCIPGAYLIGCLGRDLYRIDRVILRLVSHLCTIAVVLLLLTSIEHLFALDGTLMTMWSAVYAVVLYRPVLHGWNRVTQGVQRFTPLDHTHAKLSTTLEANQLIATIVAGIQATFGAPAFAVYHQPRHDADDLHCVSSDRLDSVPFVFPIGAVSAYLHAKATVVDSRSLARLLLTDHSPDEQQLLLHPGIALWCPIRHPRGHLLAVILLGQRGDLDPYRPADVVNIQHLLDASALALTNHATYAAQCAAEQHSRHLYCQLQHVQQETSAKIARDIHDDIINVHVRLNIEALQRLQGDGVDSTLQEELALLLEGEHGINAALRLVCEQLHPTGIDDLYGLPGVVRMHVAKMQSFWNGTCSFSVDGEPCPVAAHVQHNVLAITKEAITNAIKHAQATLITVKLVYADASVTWPHLIVTDNGQSGLTVTRKSGHFGLKNMEAAAQMIGGTLQWIPSPSGTSVVVTFPPLLSINDEKGTLHATSDYAIPVLGESASHT